MPKVIGETNAGEPVVVVRGVRLVLRDHATFFNRLVPCSDCGRETPGSAVRAPTDLDLRPSPATCRECRRAAAAAMAPVEPVAEAERPPVAAAPAPVEVLSGPRLDDLEARIGKLQAAVDEQAARAVSAESAGQEAAAEVNGLGRRLTQRLDKLEAKGRGAGTDDHRIEALERRVEQVAALMAEREARFEKDVDGVRASATASAAEIEARMGTVEARADAVVADLAELADLHAALDVGLGKLRSELGAVRDRQRDISVLQDEFDRRLETVAAIQRAVTTDEGKGRRAGKRSGEFSTQLAAAQVATDELAKEQKHLRAQLSVIELATDRAAETAGKAWSQVSVVAPLLMQVDALEERLEIQNEALAALTETVQSLLRSGPVKLPPAKAPVAKAPAAKAPAAKKAPRAAKSAAPRK